jgi:hypothetical protein
MILWVAVALYFVMPAQAGIHERRAASRVAWMPAFAGMTMWWLAAGLITEVAQAID